MKPKRILIMFFLLSSFIFAFPFASGLAAGEEIVIKTLPEKVLFSIKNMAPGRSDTKVFAIQNGGKEDFNYKTSVKLKSGSEKLYNELLVEFSDQDKVLYKGSLKNLNKIEPRFLAKSISEKFSIKVIEPGALGNDFQGLGCELEFRFYAESIVPGTKPDNGTVKPNTPASSTPGAVNNVMPNNLISELPNTATNFFNLILVGIIFVAAGVTMQSYMNKRKKLA
jgi:hypothetical protein